MLVIKEVLFNQLAHGMFIYISPPLINHSNLKSRALGRVPGEVQDFNEARPGKEKSTSES